ncbi:GntR family transcriptional regulator [Lactobacillus sp. CC-MHH1034]|nr:GntR family transcriptional regulator [Agrilactobacillus fermenti]
MVTKKYELVGNGVKEKILDGTYKINDKLPTESELMSMYDVSRYTVRRAMSDLENEHYVYRIQGGGMFVNDWRSAEENNNTNQMIGIITTHIADYIFPNIISGADQIISDNGFGLALSNTHNDPKRERKALMSILNSNVVGLIVEPTRSTMPASNLDLYLQIEQKRLPMVFINAQYPNLNAVSVTTDDFKGVKKLTEYLFSIGHRRILGVFQVDDQQGMDRMAGFTAAFQAASGLELNSSVIMYQSSDHRKNILAQVEDYLNLNVARRPTAIVCYNDELAFQVVDSVKSEDLSVPDDISITGFDNYYLGEYFDPTLTTLTHEKEKMGHDAANLLISMLHHKKVSSIVYEPDLLIRNSTKATSKNK